MNNSANDSPFHAYADLQAGHHRTLFQIRILEGVTFFLLFPSVFAASRYFQPTTTKEAWIMLGLTVLVVMLPAWLGVLALRRRLRQQYKRFQERLRDIDNAPVRVTSTPANLQRATQRPTPG